MKFPSGPGGNLDPLSPNFRRIALKRGGKHPKQIAVTAASSTIDGMFSLGQVAPRCRFWMALDTQSMHVLLECGLLNAHCSVGGLWSWT